MQHPLNAQQLAAVKHLAGPLLVIAGAGSGKTRVITAKILHLIELGHAPESVFAITFTNKAAREMRERVAALLGKDRKAGSVAISTFHSLGLRILREEAVAAGLKPSFSILDSDDAEQIVADLLASTDRQIARESLARIGSLKNRLLDPDLALAAATSEGELQLAKLYRRYTATLAAYQAVDFDDLIARPISLLETHAEVAERWRARIAYLLIDEYQDTNPAQYRLLRLLSGESGAFTAVGDDDQAIYGWRGATVENLAQLTRDYPGLAVIALEQNYRSTIRILRSANQLIRQNTKLFEKRLWSDMGLGDPISVYSAADEDDEADQAVRKLLAHKFQHRTRFSDYAVLYRGNHQARPFEQQLRANAIPYRVSGGQSFFDRAEIKDLVAYLRLVANEDDDPAFIRAVTTPKRGVGEQSLSRLGAIGARLHVSLYAAVFSAPAERDLGPRQLGPVSEFCNLIASIRYRAEKEPAGELLAELVKRIGYESWLFDSFDLKQAEQRWKNVTEFTAWLSRKGEAEDRNLLELAQHLALLATLEEADGNERDEVRLSTLHAAKGLEFPHVTIVGVEEGILPHRSSIDADTVEEERRLMYVGVTRAQRSLALSWCRTRRRARETVDGTISRFVGEMPREDLRFAGEPAGDAKDERAAGLDRLKLLKASLSR